MSVCGHVGVWACGHGMWWHTEELCDTINLLGISLHLCTIFNTSLFFFFSFVTGRLRSDAVEARLGLDWMGTGYTRSCSPIFFGC